MLKLVFLGKFRDLAPDDLAQDVPTSVGTLAELMIWIAQREPALGQALQATRTQLALNQELVRDWSGSLGGDDEVAFLPPMSGG